MEAASPQPLNLHDELLRDFHDTVRIGSKSESCPSMRARGREGEMREKQVDHLVMRGKEPRHQGQRRGVEPNRRAGAPFPVACCSISTWAPWNRRFVAGCGRLLSRKTPQGASRAKRKGKRKAEKGRACRFSLRRPSINFLSTHPLSFFFSLSLFFSLLLSFPFKNRACTSMRRSWA